MSLFLTICTILYASKKKYVFLGVDELLKSKNPSNESLNNIRTILTTIGQKLNVEASFHTLVTTLDQSIFISSKFQNSNLYNRSYL
jgi:hypothetical protein